MTRSFLALQKESFLLVVDIQESFRSVLPGFDQVVKRSTFLVKCAHILGIPVVCTEQNPTKLGGTAAPLKEALGDSAVLSKMSFSAWSAPGMREWVESTGRTHAVVVGIETHICVNQTVHDLVKSCFGVTLATDALGSRHAEGHASALQRLSSAGAVMSHSESIVYEWLESADSPHFRAILPLVKEFGPNF